MTGTAASAEPAPAHTGRRSRAARPAGLLSSAAKRSQGCSALPLYPSLPASER
jgi:hypothetical protein